MRHHEGAGVAGDEADEARIRRRQRIGPGRAEMGGVDDARHADAAVPGERAGLVHGAVHGDVAEPVIGIDQRHGAPRDGRP